MLASVDHPAFTASDKEQSLELRSLCASSHFIGQSVVHSCKKSSMSSVLSVSGGRNAVARQGQVNATRAEGRGIRA